MTVTNLIETIVIEHKKLEAALTKLHPDQLETAIGGEWTVKETLVHITSWERTLMEDHARWERGEPLTELQGQGAVDAVNAKTLAEAKYISSSTALEQFAATFQQLLTWLEGLDMDELGKPFMYGMSLEEFITEDTWKHYEEHLPLLNSKGTD